jgi:hypothetical protein
MELLMRPIRNTAGSPILDCILGGKGWENSMQIFGAVSVEFVLHSPETFSSTPFSIGFPDESSMYVTERQ